MSSISHLVINEFHKVIRSSGITRYQPHETWMRSQQRIIRYRTFNLFRRNFFFKMSSVSHLFFNRFFQNVSQIIRNTQRTSLQNLNAIRPMFHKISRSQVFGRPPWKMTVYGLVPKIYMVRIAQAHRPCLWKITKIHLLTSYRELNSWYAHDMSTRPL